MGVSSHGSQRHDPGPPMDLANSVRVGMGVGECRTKPLLSSTRWAAENRTATRRDRQRGHMGRPSRPESGKFGHCRTSRGNNFREVGLKECLLTYRDTDRGQRGRRSACGSISAARPAVLDGPRDHHPLGNARHAGPVGGDMVASRQRA